jgi:tetratricopeptide (TPR) repeat protein/predicted Ser/Thr protein kinase
MDRYEIVETIGSGAMGVVYAAIDRKLDRKVALKSVKGRRRPDDPAIVRLVREAQALAKLSHPNVVGVYDIVVEDEAVFLAMELVTGRTLRDWLAATPRSTGEILDVFVQAGRGLSAAHAAGIVHRDFKPSNVVVGDDGRVRVIDFGIAALTESDASGEALVATTNTRAGADLKSHLTETGTVLGTPAYMAPEQWRGEALDARIDQYSFCVALHEALSAIPPGRNVAARVRKAIARGRESDREARFPSMDALLGDLETSSARRTQGIALATGLVLGVGSFLLVRHQATTTAALCHASEQKLVGVWDDARKKAIERAFLGTGKPFAADAWRETEATLDAYSREWAGTRMEACEATRLKKTQSETVLDLRMACLDDRMRELSTLTDVLSHADEQVVANTFTALQSLTRVAYCNDVATLTARVRPPTNPATAARVDELRGGLVRVKALDAAGKYKDAVPLAAEIEAQSRTVDDRAMQAEALLWLGRLQSRAGDLSGGEITLRAAVHAADAAGDDATRVKALGELLIHAGKEEAKHDEIPAFRDDALAAMSRVGKDDEVEAALLQAIGIATVAEGKSEEARVVLEKGLAVQVRAYGEGSWQEGSALTNLASAYLDLRRYDRGIDLDERALAILAKALGPAHPRLATPESDIGVALAMEGKPAAAEPHLRHAAEIAEGAFGPEHWQTAAFLDNLGQCLGDQGKFAESLTVHERALAGKERTLRADHPELADSLEGIARAELGLGEPAKAIPYLERALGVHDATDAAGLADVRLSLARALDGAGKDPGRAGDMAKEARDAFEKAGDKEKAAEATVWLARHQGRRGGG